MRAWEAERRVRQDHGRACHPASLKWLSSRTVTVDGARSLPDILASYVETVYIVENNDSQNLESIALMIMVCLQVVMVKGRHGYACISPNLD